MVISGATVRTRNEFRPAAADCFERKTKRPSRLILEELVFHRPEEAGTADLDVTPLFTCDQPKPKTYLVTRARLRGGQVVLLKVPIRIRAHLVRTAPRYVAGYSDLGRKRGL